MITVDRFLQAVEQNAARVKSYRLGGDGSDGTCDCVGLVIGALRLCGEKYTGTHGSNYFARYRTKNLRRTVLSELRPGDVVYKAKEPGDSGYNLPQAYAKHPDKRDYYHIGVVESVDPLRIAHCSVGGMHYDSKIGAWSWAGECDGVDYAAADEPLREGPAWVDTPNNGSLNVRSKPSGPKTDVLKEGSEVTVLSTSGAWAQIEYKRTGWVMSKYLRQGG